MILLRFAVIMAFISNFMFAAERPNIIVFLIDDQDLAECGPFAKPGTLYTPNFDRLAKEGMKFTQAYVPHTVCTPSRYAFLTGRYAGNSYSKEYLAAAPTGQQGFIDFNMCLETDNMNVGRVLSDAGYVTGFVGKFHVGPDLDQQPFATELNTKLKRMNLKSGPEADAIFQKYELILSQLIQQRGFTWADHVMHANLNDPYAVHNPDWMAEAALKFIAQNKAKPFYLHYCPTLLHGPDNSWRKDMDHPDITGAGQVKPDPVWLKRRQDVLEKTKALGMTDDHQVGIAWIDSNLGVLLDQLDALGLTQNTLIVFAPDHGSTLKSSLYARDSCQIPMLMRWPAGIAAGSTCAELVQSIDLAPTWFELAKAKVPEGYHLDGRDLTPLFKTGTTDQWRDSLYFEIDNLRAVMTKDWRYIATRYTKDRLEMIHQAKPQELPKLMSPYMLRGATHPGFFDEDQLYDLRQDPDEMKNLAASPEFSAQLKTMKSKLKEYLEKQDRPFGEFIEGGNAVPGGQIDAQVAVVKQLEIKGKTIIVPAHLNGGKEGVFNAKETKTKGGKE